MEIQSEELLLTEDKVDEEEEQQQEQQQQQQQQPQPQQQDEENPSTIIAVGVSFENPRIRPKATCIDHCFKAFIGFLVLVNIVVVCLSIRAMTARRGPGEDCPRRRRVVAPVCLPCGDVLEGEGKVEVEGAEEEEGGWKRFKNGGSDCDMCCPLDHRRVATAVSKIYRTARKDEHQRFLQRPQEPYLSYTSLFGEPETTEQTLTFANRRKPSGHVTGVQRFDPKHCSESSNSGRPAANRTLTLCDWPIRVEAYRSMTAGYVRRLTWGLIAPTSGLYRIHTTVNFYFQYPQNSKDKSQTEEIPVIHQISLYRAKDGGVSLLAERSHTVSGSYCDGLTSFLVTLAHLDIGDVISVNVSHRSAMAMYDRWHTEGLFLVQ